MSACVILWLQTYKIMSRGKYVFPQVMEYYPSWVFDKSVKTYNADYHVRVSSSAMCRYLLFGQLSGCKSLNDISLVLKAHEKHLYQMGFPEGIVDSSSLSRANESRDYRIYEDLGMWLIKKVGPKYAKEPIPDVYLPGWEVFAIDSFEEASPTRYTLRTVVGMTATTWM